MKSPFSFCAADDLGDEKKTKALRIPTQSLVPFLQNQDHGPRDNLGTKWLATMVPGLTLPGFRQSAGKKKDRSTSASVSMASTGSCYLTDDGLGLGSGHELDHLEEDEDDNHDDDGMNDFELLPVDGKRPVGEYIENQRDDDEDWPSRTSSAGQGHGASQREHVEELDSAMELLLQLQQSEMPSTTSAASLTHSRQLQVVHRAQHLFMQLQQTLEPTTIMHEAEPMRAWSAHHMSPPEHITITGPAVMDLTASRSLSTTKPAPIPPPEPMLMEATSDRYRSVALSSQFTYGHSQPCEYNADDNDHEDVDHEPGEPFDEPHSSSGPNVRIFPIVATEPTVTSESSLFSAPPPPRSSPSAGYANLRSTMPSSSPQPPPPIQSPRGASFTAFRHQHQVSTRAVGVSSAAAATPPVYIQPMTTQENYSVITSSIVGDGASTTVSNMMVLPLSLPNETEEVQSSMDAPPDDSTMLMETYSYPPFQEQASSIGPSSSSVATFSTMGAAAALRNTRSYREAMRGTDINNKDQRSTDHLTDGKDLEDDDDMDHNSRHSEDNASLLSDLDFKSLPCFVYVCIAVLVACIVAGMVSTGVVLSRGNFSSAQSEVPPTSSIQNGEGLTNSSGLNSSDTNSSGWGAPPVVESPFPSTTPTTRSPTARPSLYASSTPTTSYPSTQPSRSFSVSPTSIPTYLPSTVPSMKPSTSSPTSMPSDHPSDAPSLVPTHRTSEFPSSIPSMMLFKPSPKPTQATSAPLPFTLTPSTHPSTRPSILPTTQYPTASFAPTTRPPVTASPTTRVPTFSDQFFPAWPSSFPSPAVNTPVPTISAVPPTASPYTGSGRPTQLCCANGSELQKAIDSLFKVGKPGYNRKVSGRIAKMCVRDAGTFRSLFSVGRNPLLADVLGIIDLSAWDVSKVTNLSNMFRGTRFVNNTFNQPVGTWNVSSVRDIGGCFSYNSRFNQDLASWDVSHVVFMSSLFAYATNFNKFLASWKVDRVVDMSFMFQGATQFNKNIGTWNVGRVRSTASMFNGASSFNQTLATWNVSRVRDASYMFADASSFNQNLRSWSLTAASDLRYMFLNATRFNQNLCSWGASLNPKTVVKGMFWNTACPDTSDPNLTAVPPGPFCHPC